MKVTPRARKITLLFVAPLLLVGAAGVAMEGWLFGYRTANEISRLLAVEDETLFARDRWLRTDAAVLKEFYAARSFRPVWFEGRRPRPELQTLFDTAEYSRQEGLDPADYVPIPLDVRQILTAPDPDTGDMSPEQLAEIDILLTDAYVGLAYDLAFGRVNPGESCGRQCFAEREAPLLAELEEAVADDRLAELLEEFIPRSLAYARLKDVLAAYRNVACRGGWPQIPGGAGLKQGMSEARVAVLRERLRLSGDLSGETSDANFYDDGLANAVRRFQQRNGVKASGKVDDRTLLLLNRPVEEDIRRIEINLERWRWLPHDLGGKYILVNVPAFHLFLVEGGKTVLDMRTIVGRPPWYTPSFSGRITYLEVNPVWRIPPNILREEVAPAILRDPGYAARKQITLYGRDGRGYREMSPETIDWKRIKPQAFPYLAVQKAGPGNPLGRVKFMFPNQNHIYLHDSPSKHLFRREPRMFSHGCIRIEKPHALAEHLLQADRDWTRKRFAAVVQSGKTGQIPLREPVAVHVVYFTAWVDEGGILHTRPDVYGSDEALDIALRKRAELLAGTSID